MPSPPRRLVSLKAAAYSGLFIGGRGGARNWVGESITNGLHSPQYGPITNGNKLTGSCRQCPAISLVTQPAVPMGISGYWDPSPVRRDRIAAAARLPKSMPLALAMWLGTWPSSSASRASILAVWAG